MRAAKALASLRMRAGSPEASSLDDAIRTKSHVVADIIIELLMTKCFSSFPFIGPQRHIIDAFV